MCSLVPIDTPHVCSFSSHHNFCVSPTCFIDDVNDPDYVDAGDSDSDYVRSEGDTSLVHYLL